MSYFNHLNPYEIHQKLINDYILKRPGDTKKLFVRDASKDKTDIDVIRENHKFLWDEDDDTIDSWEKQLAKRYYDKLFKEYCIADLSRYKENKVSRCPPFQAFRLFHQCESFDLHFFASADSTTLADRQRGGQWQRTIHLRQ